MTLVLGCSIVTVSTFSIPEFSGVLVGRVLVTVVELVFSIIFDIIGLKVSGLWFVGGVTSRFSGAS